MVGICLSGCILVLVITYKGFCGFVLVFWWLFGVFVVVSMMFY